MPSITKVFGAAVLLAYAQTTMTAGTAFVYNQCGTNVYYKTITTSEEAFQTIPSGGVSVPYSDPGQGVSIKLSLTGETGPVSQFEFTLSGDSIFYDLSNIDGDPSAPDGYPFSAGGITVTPSMASDEANPTCDVISCPAGTLVCSAAYNAPDDPRTLVCSQESDITMVLCPNGTAISSKREVPAQEVHQHGAHHRRTPGHPHARR